VWLFLLDGSGFALFIGLVVTLGAWEWARLAGFSAQLPRVVYAVIVALLLFLMYILPDLAPWVLGAAVLWWALATFLVLTYPRTSSRVVQRCLQAGDRLVDSAAGVARAGGDQAFSDRQ